MIENFSWEKERENKRIAFEQDCRAAIFLTNLYYSVPEQSHNMWEQGTMNMHNDVIGLRVRYMHEFDSYDMAKADWYALQDAEMGNVDMKHITTKWLLDRLSPKNDYKDRIGALCIWISTMLWVLELHRDTFIHNWVMEE